MSLRLMRKMHHRQMIRRGIVVLVVLAILGAVTAISFPVYKQLEHGMDTWRLWLPG